MQNKQYFHSASVTLKAGLRNVTVQFGVSLTLHKQMSELFVNASFYKICGISNGERSVYKCKAGWAYLKVILKCPVSLAVVCSMIGDMLPYEHRLKPFKAVRKCPPAWTIQQGDCGRAFFSFFFFPWVLRCDMGVDSIETMTEAGALSNVCDIYKSPLSSSMPQKDKWPEEFSHLFVNYSNRQSMSLCSVLAIISFWFHWENITSQLSSM